MTEILWLCTSLTTFINDKISFDGIMSNKQAAQGTAVLNV